MPMEWSSIPEFRSSQVPVFSSSWHFLLTHVQLVTKNVFNVWIADQSKICCVYRYSPPQRFEPGTRIACKIYVLQGRYVHVINGCFFDRTMCNRPTVQAWIKLNIITNILYHIYLSFFLIDNFASFNLHARHEKTIPAHGPKVSKVCWINVFKI